MADIADQIERVTLKIEAAADRYDALAKSNAELIVALGNYADDDECVCSLDPRAPHSDCCACIAQGVLDRARKL